MGKHLLGGSVVLLSRGCEDSRTDAEPQDLDMPNGEPEASSTGLDRSQTWGSTYWGGAMFCLVADVRIREQTRNRKGLQDALRGIVTAGGAIDEEWGVGRGRGTGGGGVRCAQ